MRKRPQGQKRPKGPGTRLEGGLKSLTTLASPKSRGREWRLTWGREGLERLKRLAAMTLLLVAFQLVVSGCRSASPYESFRSWAVRQSETPPYAADYDLIYFYPRLSNWHEHANATNTFLTVESRMRPFGFAAGATVRDYRQPRIFAPYVSPGEDVTSGDVREAIGYYLDNYHDDGRLYAIVAEGESAKPVRSAVESELGWCGDIDREDGYLAAFFTPEDGRELDMEELSLFLKRLVKSARLTQDWRRPVPPDVEGISETTLEAWHGHERHD